MVSIGPSSARLTDIQIINFPKALKNLCFGEILFRKKQKKVTMFVKVIDKPVYLWYNKGTSAEGSFFVCRKHTKSTAEGGTIG